MQGRTYHKLTDVECQMARRAVERMLTGQLDYESIKLADAYQFRVPVRVRGKNKPILKTLRWVARHKPAHLERLMSGEPGSVLYHAVVLVYNDNIDRIDRATAQVKREHQVRCRQLLRSARVKRGEATTNHPFLGVGGVTRSLARRFLPPEVLRESVREVAESN